MSDIDKWEREHSIYFLRFGNGPEREVTEEEFIAVERSAGFYPKAGCGPLATGGFSKGDVSGRIEHRTKEPE